MKTKFLHNQKAEEVKQLVIQAEKSITNNKDCTFFKQSNNMYIYSDLIDLVSSQGDEDDRNGTDAYNVQITVKQGKMEDYLCF